MVITEARARPQADGGNDTVAGRKSQTTTWDGARTPVNNGMNRLSSGAGFLPSTVLI